MNLRMFSGVVILLTVLTSSCAPLPKPISGKAAGIQNYLGLFTIIPPQGNNWYEIQRRAGLLAYGKKLTAANHTFIASVYVSKTDKIFTNDNDFLTFVKTSRANDTSLDRFNVLVHEENLDRSRTAYCTKFHMKTEDKNAAKSNGALSVLESKGFTCLHPKQPLLVTIEYSERTAAPFTDAALLKEGEGFINSLKLQ